MGGGEWVYRVEGVSIREISRRTGLHRKTIRRALAAAEPPSYSRAPAGSKLDPFKDWICEQLAVEPRMQSQRLRELATELGYAGGKTGFDDYVREVRPRFARARTFQRTARHRAHRAARHTPSTNSNRSTVGLPFSAIRQYFRRP